MTKKYTTKQNMTFREATTHKRANIVFLHAENPKMKGRLNEIEDALIQIGDPEWIYKFALEYPAVANIKKIENALIDCCNKYKPRYMLSPPERNLPTPFEWLYTFAMDIPGANRPKIQSVISECYDPRAIFEYARNIPRANIALLTNAIINTGDLDWIYKFARNVKRVTDFSKLQEAIVNSGSYKYILNFAKFIKDADIPLMQKQMLEIICSDCVRSYHYDYLKKIVDFTQNFDELSFEYIEDYLLNKENFKLLARLVQYHPEANTTKIATTIAKKDLEEFISFANALPIDKLLEIENLDKIESAIIKKYNLGEILTKKLPHEEIKDRLAAVRYIMGYNDLTVRSLDCDIMEYCFRKNHLLHKIDKMNKEKSIQNEEQPEQN